MKAKYIQKGDSVDIVPSFDLAAGEVVKLGNLIGVTKLPISKGTLGTIAISGVFDVHKPQGFSFYTGENVYCNSKGEVDKEGTLLGISVSSATATSEHVRILLNCNTNSSLPITVLAAEWQQL